MDLLLNWIEIARIRGKFSCDHAIRKQRRLLPDAPLQRFPAKTPLACGKNRHLKLTSSVDANTKRPFPNQARANLSNASIISNRMSRADSYIGITTINSRNIPSGKFE